MVVAASGPIGTFGNFVTERVATGGAISGVDDVMALRRAGITHVVDCRAEFNDGQLLARRFHYLWNPTQDDGQPKPPAWFALTLGFSLPALAHPKHRLYLHCAAGINRGPSSAYAVLRALGVPQDDAMRLIKAGRPQAQVRYAPDADLAIVALGYT